MVVNENAGWQVPRGVLWFFASRLFWSSFA
ncbi:hypothetical protein PMI26_06023, partial [Pseudomonas sp. GM33]